jgi:DMSO/TMAO reductase YedYZ heme-binding membrane subunit
MLHRLVYAAAVAGCLHFLWLLKADHRRLRPVVQRLALAR